jgi:hypothetical protein
MYKIPKSTGNSRQKTGQKAREIRANTTGKKTRDIPGKYAPNAREYAKMHTQLTKNSTLSGWSNNSILMVKQYPL